MKTTTSSFFKILLIAATVVMFTPSEVSAWSWHWSSHDKSDKGSSDKESCDKDSKGSTDKGSKGSCDKGSKGSNDKGSKGSSDKGSKGSNDKGSKGSCDKGSKGSTDKGSKGSCDKGSKGSNDKGSKGSCDKGSKGSNDKGSKGSCDKGSKGSHDKGSTCKPKGKVCGLIFEDTNDNGQFDKTTDMRLENITVNLTDIDNKTYSVTTNVQGKYCIYNVAYGEATVTVDETTLPENSLQVVGDNPTILDVKKCKTTYAGKDGYILLDPIGQLHGQVTVDGQGYANITLNITDANGDIHTVITDANGNWVLNSLPLGNATVDVDETTLPADAERSIGIDNDTFSIEAGIDTDAGIDGYILPLDKGDIHGQVIYEGIGQANVTLYITDSSGDVHTVITDADGNWVLHSLPLGSATVDVDETTLPADAERSIGIDNDTFPIEAGMDTDAGIDGYTAYVP